MYSESRCVRANIESLHFYPHLEFFFARYMFDEASSYLDIKQRLRAAEVIRSLLTPDCYVVAVEHDLSVLDYLSDFICCLYGKPSMYGVVTMPSSVREGQSPPLNPFFLPKYTSLTFLESC
jgi:translation initiation factor RLI1